MTQPRGQRWIPRRDPARSTWNRRAKLRALLLTSIWMVPGIWCTGHSIAHALEAGQHELHQTDSLGDRLTGLTRGHHHDHKHVDLPAVVSSEGAKKLGSLALLTTTGTLESSRATTQIHSLAWGGHTPRLTSADSGPRAPPLS